MLEVTLLCLTAARLASSACSATGPISLPVTDVLLSNRHVMRGVPFTVGTPPQNISFMPHHYLNDTWIYNSTYGFCDADTGGTSKDFCITYRGGEYDVAASSTAKPASSVYAAGGDPTDAQRTLGTHLWDSAWANDVLSFSNIALPGFAIGMPSWDFGGTFDTQNNIGMGKNSTLLTALQQSGKIASRSWSWWWGQTGATDDVQMDGSIVFGGYDKAKIISDTRYTQKLSDLQVGCDSGMWVTITDLVLNFPNGTQTSILSPNQLTACLQPDFTVLMTLPNAPYYNNFEQYTQTTNLGRGGGNGIGARGMLYWPDKVYQGSLTVELNNVFSVEIPNSLLAVPPQVVMDDGSIFTNTSVSEVLLDPTLAINSDDPAILGRPFFSSSYLYVDHDAETFTLWQANPTDISELTILGGDCSSPEVNAPANNRSTSNSSNTGSTSSNRTKPGNAGRITTGEIAGAVVGSVIVAAAVVAALFFSYFRKRRASAMAEQKDGKTDDEQHNPAQVHDSQERAQAWQHQPGEGPQFSEAPSSEVQEMGTQQDPRELAGRERPAELHTGAHIKDHRRRFLAANNSPIEVE